MEKVCGVNGFARNVVIFGVDNTYHFIMKIKKITFQYWEKDQPNVLMIALVQQKKKLVLTLVKQRQNLV